MRRHARDDDRAACQTRAKLHWHTESVSRRRQILSTVAGFDIAAIVVAGTPLDPRRQERARAQCLDELLMALDRLGVGQVSLEQREQKLNQRDLRHIDRLRGLQMVSKSLRIDMARPSVEPMLWIADAICGCVGAARAGEKEWIDLLGQGIQIMLR